MLPDDAIERCLRMLPKPDSEVEAVHIRTNIGIQIPTALGLFGKQVAGDPKFADYQMADFVTGALVAGIVDIVNLTNGVNGQLYIEYMQNAVVLAAGISTPLQWVQDIAALNKKRQTERFYIHYCMDGTVLRTRNTDGSLTSLTGALTIKGSYEPTLLQVNQRIEHMFLKILAQMVEKSLKGTVVAKNPPPQPSA